MATTDAGADTDTSVRMPERHRVAILVPCYNEAATIADVVTGFRTALPGSVVYVYDNNSTDKTVEVARAAGAVVRRETHQGKGYVVRRMFADVDADIYLLVDGDATYDAPSAREMIARLIDERLDMVLAARVDREEAAYRRGHRFGNRLQIEACDISPRALEFAQKRAAASGASPPPRG